MRHANDNHAGEPLRFLSVCSGIEAASVAWKPLGWQCIGVAEIEPFPAFVLAHHYGAGRPRFMPDPMEPGLKPKDGKSRKAALKAVSRLPVDAPLTNWGDFTKIDTTQLGRVDILAGGTPCQAFSVAGLRGGLDDVRGNLTLKFVELAHELADGNGLRNVVWENVVGVLSDKTNAFGCFLAGLVGAATPFDPPTRGKWGNAGMVSGPKGRAAWRVLDAQYFGVAQRRRRVLVVADFGNGADPAQVLFELDGVLGNPAPSREARKDVAGTTAGSTGSSGETRGVDAVAWSIMPQNSGKDYKARQVDVAQPLMAAGPVGGNQGGDYIQQPVAYAPEIARCVATREGSSQDYETTTMMAVCVTGEVAHTLKAEGADASEDGTGRSTPIVSYRIAGSGEDYEEGDKCAPLTTGTDPNAHVIAFSAKDYGGDAAIELAPTLRAGGHKGSHANAGVMPAIAFDTTQITSKANGSNPKPGDPCHPLSAGAHPPAITVALRGREGGATAELGGEVATALRASSGGGDKPHVLAFTTEQTPKFNENCALTLTKQSPTGGGQIQSVAVGSAVRRLTPTECERLQGFPDHYTDIPWRGKPTIPDGPRYKALGNSWAVPKFTWLGRRIAAHMPVAVSLRAA